MCNEVDIKGFTTPVIISNLYYLLRKTAKHETIVAKLNQLLNIIDVVSVNRNVVFNALNSAFKDFEDALQNFSAVETNEIKIILTRNVKDFKKSNLLVLTPEIFLKGKASSY